jgi:hypothetical protein
LETTVSRSRTRKATSSVSNDRPIGTLIARVATGVVLGFFGFWELTGPSQWTGYVPHAVGALVSPVSLVLFHGWILFVLSTAALIDFTPPLTSWIAVMFMAEVVVGLLLTSGLTDILIRDLGLLALALVWALDSKVQHLAGSPPHGDGKERASV